MSVMNDSLRDVLQKQLNLANLDLVDLVPIPKNKDRLTRLRTLEELLEDFETTEGDTGSFGFVVQVRTKEQPSSPQGEPKSIAAESVYLPNGKLNLSYLFKNATLLFTSGEYSLARNIYKTILLSGERSAMALYGVARCCEAEHKDSEAMTHYEESLAYHPTIEAFQRLSYLLIRKGKDQEAAEILERALSIKDLSASQRFEFHKACGNCWTRLKKIENAENQYNAALQINPSADEIRANLGVVYLQAGKTTEAKRHFQDAAASNARNAKALAGLGSCLLAEGDAQSAHDCFVKSLDLELNNPSALFCLIRCAYELKSYSTAAQLVSAYVQSAPVNANLLFSLAGLQFHLGRIDDARAALRTVLTIQPDHSGAKELLEAVNQFAGSAF